MTTTVTAPLTVLDIARTGIHDAASEPLDRHVDDAVNAAGEHHALGVTTGRSMDAQVRAMIDGALQGDIVGVLAAGWQSSRALHAAALETVAEPGSRQVVELVQQTVTHTTNPSVEVDVDGVRAATIALSVTVELTFHDLAAAVADGAVVGLEFGLCDVAVSIASEQQLPLLHRTMTLTSSAQLPLPRPIPLLR